MSHIVSYIKPENSPYNDPAYIVYRNGGICIRFIIYEVAETAWSTLIGNWRISISLVMSPRDVTRRSGWWMFVSPATRRDEKRGTRTSKTQNPQTFDEKSRKVLSRHYGIHLNRNLMVSAVSQYVSTYYFKSSGELLNFCISLTSNIYWIERNI